MQRRDKIATTKRKDKLIGAALQPTIRLPRYTRHKSTARAEGARNAPLKVCENDETY